MANTSSETTQYDVVVIGGGPAGLQATLTLARVHRRVLMLDSGQYRNDPATHMHNVVTHDGTPPAEFRAAAQKDIAAYDTASIRTAAATEVAADGDGFRVSIGAEVVTARGVVLATGVRDTLPDKPGLAELFGDVVAHCPFCHGHEFAGRPVAIVGDAAHLVGIMAPVASTVTLIGEAEVERFERAEDGVRIVRTDGSAEEYGGAFVSTRFEQSAPFAEQLGLTLLPSGCIEVDAMARTSLPGVHAAGDLAHVATLPMPMSSVLSAAAAGQVAAGAMVAYLL
jgi:thioredoxin reductase